MQIPVREGMGLLIQRASLRYTLRYHYCFHKSYFTLHIFSLLNRIHNSNAYLEFVKACEGSFVKILHDISKSSKLGNNSKKSHGNSHIWFSWMSILQTFSPYILIQCLCSMCKHKESQYKEIPSTGSCLSASTTTLTLYVLRYSLTWLNEIKKRRKYLKSRFKYILLALIYTKYKMADRVCWV